MRGSKQELPVSYSGNGVELREAEWGDMNVGLEQFPVGLETAPIFVGLPDDRCQCPHWGYVISGRFRAIYKDREETLSAGDLYYLAPGHTTAFDEPTQLVEFSPRGEYQKTMDVAVQNIMRMS
jgi:hypothetical protein